MHLVDEEKDLPLGLCDLVEDALEALLKLAAELCPRDERAHIERVERLVLQRLGDIARHNATCQPLDNRRLTDARLTDEHGVVLGTA